MVHLPATPQNWSRTFTVWIEDIQVSFPSDSVTRVIRGGFLRWVRGRMRLLAGVLNVFFAIHCTQAHAVVPVLLNPEHPLTSWTPSPLAPGWVAKSAFEQVGLASWYGDGDGFEDLETASGEPLRSDLATCAHRTLPFGTLLEVENLDNQRRTLVRVNDRGPFVRGRIVDVSARAAKELGMQRTGVSQVKVRAVIPVGLPALVAPAAEEPRLHAQLPHATVVSLARKSHTGLQAPLLKLVPDLFSWGMAGLPVQDSQPAHKGFNHGRWPFLHREIC